MKPNVTFKKRVQGLYILQILVLFLVNNLRFYVFTILRNISAQIKSLIDVSLFKSDCTMYNVLHIGNSIGQQYNRQSPQNFDSFHWKILRFLNTNKSIMQFIQGQFSILWRILIVQITKKTKKLSIKLFFSSLYSSRKKVSKCSCRWKKKCCCMRKIFFCRICDIIYKYCTF